MSTLGYYFHIPRDCAEYLGGVRWSRSGEVIEYADGGTFAFRSEVGLFLEGLVANRRLIHFGFILHLLHLLTKPDSAPELHEAFRKVGRPLRNAGAFCGVLCQHVPAVPADLDAATVCRQLYSGSMMSILFVSWNNGLPEEAGEVPPLSPLHFERQVLRVLAEYTTLEIEHWLKHGRGPIKGAAQQLARELEALKPQSLSNVLASLTQRPRLAGAVPFVAQLVSALTLPPRRRTEHELPTGGYADVHTHGHPEQLLPSQFALDELEFVRRFAENELLYFRREEPHAHTQEELILLLDQGVRTWGEVRLLLSAAVFAFGKLAMRRGMPLRIAGTSSEGRLLDPRLVKEEELGELLDASDLTPNPALALERVLEQPAQNPRDVVLLTQPRNLVEADVAVAARRLTPPTRLFGLSVDADGRVELSQLKRGNPVALTRFRVDLHPPTPRPERLRPGDRASSWKGDVEPIPFPFQLGIVGKVDLQKFDFDHEGKWLVVLTSRNFLQAFALDGSVMEILPRALCKRALFPEPDALLGVAGGCVLAGRAGDLLRVVHYDFTQRSCTSYQQAIPEQHAWQWFYFHEYHSVVARHETLSYGLDLGTGAWHPFHIWTDVPKTRAESACYASNSLNGPRTSLNISHDPSLRATYPTLCLDRRTGTVSLQGVVPPWQAFTPLADGKPMLKGACALDPAHWQGNLLAFNAHHSEAGSPTLLRLFRAPEGVLVSEFRQPSPHLGFALSHEGLLARMLEGNTRGQLEVRDLSRDSVVFLTPRGRCHPGFLAELGRMQLALFIGKMTHLIEWKHARLEISFTRTDRYVFLDRKAGSWIPASTVATQDDLRAIPGFDDQRFVRAAQGEVTVLIDRFGHLAVLDRLGELVCMFFAFRERLAGWMPDGTRFGHPGLTGGAETPGARERIGQALFRASQLGGSPPLSPVLGGEGSGVRG